MKTHNWPIASLMLLVAPVASFADVQATFYVAPNGNDANPGTREKPFASIERAQQAVRAINKDMTGDVVVELAGGTYSIERMIAFNADDSGTGAHNVIYRAAQGEPPIISGGKRITGWHPDEKGRWRAPAPLDDFRQLYVDGKRAMRARGDAPAELTPTLCVLQFFGPAIAPRTRCSSGPPSR